MPYDPNCLTESRVFVNGTRLPAGDVDIHLRKEGPLDISRYAEVTFASPFRGEDFLQYFGTSTPNKQEKFDTLRIDIRDSVQNEYAPVFHGVVTGLGNDDSENERMWKTRAQGIGLLLDKIYISQEYESTNVRPVLNDVTEKLQERVPVSITLGGDQQDAEVLPTVVGEGIYDERNTETYQAALIASLVTDAVETPKTFKGNKHTLKDVIEWVREKAGIRIWLEPTLNGVSFVAIEEPTQVQHTAHYLDGNVGVIENNALSELRPVNTLTLHSAAKKSISEYADFELNVPVNRFVKVKARHPDLYRRAGDTELSVGPIESSSAEEKDEAIEEAKSLLKDKIDQATGGDMHCLITKPIRPFDRITALPTCQEQPDRTVDPLTYEVSRVHYQIRTTDQSKSVLNVGVPTVMDDIEIIDTWTKDI